MGHDVLNVLLGQTLDGRHRPKIPVVGLDAALHRHEKGSVAGPGRPKGTRKPRRTRYPAIKKAA